MRKSLSIVGATILGLAAVAAAQEPAPPADPPRKGLSDLEATVNELSDAAQDELAPAAPAEEPAPAAEPPPPAAPPPTAPAAPARPAPPLTAPQQAELERIVERGRLLIAIAGAGQIATQDMLARVANPNAAGIDGWIAEPAGNGVTVTFYADEEDGPKAVYRANVLGNRVVSRDTFLGSFRPDLTRAQARLTAARAATEGLEVRPCTSQPFNVIVVPPSGGSDAIDVYRLSAPAERGRFPLGGHFRARVNADGAIASSRSFAEGCPVATVAEPTAGQQPQPIPAPGTAGDQLPSEVHILLSRMSGRPLLLTTGDPARQWLIAGERVAEVRDGEVVARSGASAPSPERPQGR